MAYLNMFRQLWRYAGNERWKIVVYLLLHTISVLGELGKPLAFALVINTLQANKPSLIHDVWHWLMVYLMCFFTFEVFHRSARYIERFVAFRTRQRYVDALYDQLHALPLRWHAEHHSGDLINRVNIAGEALLHFGESPGQLRRLRHEVLGTVTRPLADLADHLRGGVVRGFCAHFRDTQAL